MASPLALEASEKIDLHEAEDRITLVLQRERILKKIELERESIKNDLKKKIIKNEMKSIINRILNDFNKRIELEVEEEKERAKNQFLVEELERKEKLGREILAKRKKEREMKLIKYMSKKFFVKTKGGVWDLFEVKDVASVMVSVIEESKLKAGKLNKIYHFMKGIKEKETEIKDNILENKEEKEEILSLFSEFEDWINEIKQNASNDNDFNEIKMMISSIDILLKKAHFYSINLYYLFIINFIDEAISESIQLNNNNKLCLLSLKMLGNQHDTLFNYMYSKLLFLCPIVLPSLIDKDKNEPVYGEWKSKPALIENGLPYFELYCKLILTSGDGIIPEFEDKNDQFETQEIWIWLLRFISNGLVGSEYSTYLKLMLKECGTKLIKDYKIQGIKLLRYLQVELNNKPNQSIIKEIKDEIELLLTKNMDDKNTNISKPKDSSQQKVSEYTIKQTYVQEMQLEAANYQKGIYILKKLNQNIDNKIELKKKRFDIRKKIRPKLSQINNTRTVVMEVLNNIQAILNDAKLCHHSLYIWTLNFLVKQAIKQTETEIISNLSMAFPLAKLLLLLCKNNFELRNLLNIRFYKRCPYILPNTLPKYSEEIKPEIYKKRMGYIQKDNRFEELDVYIKRINAIFYLYCALLQFDERDGINNTYGIDHAWLWLSRCLIVAPNEVSAELLNTFLIVCGGKLIVSYKAQTIKLIQYIEREYFPKLDLKLKATQFRLQITLEKMKENNYFIQFPIGRDFNGESNRSLLKTQYDSANNNNVVDNNPSYTENNNPFSFAKKDDTTTQFSFTNTKNENSNTQTSFGFSNTINNNNNPFSFLNTSNNQTREFNISNFADGFDDDDDDAFDELDDD